MATKKELEIEVARLREEQAKLVSQMQGLQTNLIEQVVKSTLSTLQGAKKDPIQAEMLWRLRRTRREFVYRKILDTLESKGKDLAELKYLIVDQGRYCSKATFYRYIEDLKGINRISIAEMENRLVAMRSEQFSN